MATSEVNIFLKSITGIQLILNLNVDWVIISYAGVLLLVTFCRKSI